MADEQDHDQKTEQPTEKRLADAFERGQFAKSHEITVLFAFVALLGALGFTAQAASQRLPVARQLLNCSGPSCYPLSRASTKCDRDHIADRSHFNAAGLRQLYNYPRHRD